MKNNSRFIILIFLAFSKTVYPQSLNELIELSLKNNPEILSAQNNYNSSILSSKTLDGVYSPQISLSSSTTFPDKYDWDKNPDFFSANITYKQPLPGGMTLSFSGGANFSTTNILDEPYISQNSNLSFSLSQSLLPFWGQGKIKDPARLSANQQRDYYYNQLLYTRKSVLQSLIQNYIYLQINKKEAQIYQNFINLLDKQIENSKELKSTGAVSLTQTTEYISSKWNYQEDLLKVQSNYANYMQNLKLICGTNFEDDITQDLLGDLTSTIQNVTDNISDPLEKVYQLKLEMLKTNYILEKQSSAPVLSLSIQPMWTLEKKKQFEWKDAWKDFDSPSSWSITADLNLSTFIYAAVKKNKRQYELDYQEAENILNAYIAQKRFVRQQYENVLGQYESQLEAITRLYEDKKSELLDIKIQFNSGAISKLDYDSAEMHVENCRLSKEIIEVNVWLYRLMKDYWIL